eukprot:6244367-Prymnesium_polylepis.1
MCIRDRPRGAALGCSLGLQPWVAALGCSLGCGPGWCAHLAGHLIDSELMRLRTDDDEGHGQSQGGRGGRALRTGFAGLASAEAQGVRLRLPPK